MNTFLTFIIAASCFVIGALSPILNHPLLSPVYIVPVCLASLVILAVVCSVKRPLFNPSIRREPVVKWLTLGLLALGCMTGLSSCVETTTRAPDGTVTTIKAPAPGSLELAGKAIEVIGSGK